MNIQKQIYKKMGWYRIDFDSDANYSGHTDLTTPEGFFKLFNAMKEGDDWKKFFAWVVGANYIAMWNRTNVEAIINPERFFNAVCEFYGLEE